MLYLQDFKKTPRVLLHFRKQPAQPCPRGLGRLAGGSRGSPGNSPPCSHGGENWGTLGAGSACDWACSTDLSLWSQRLVPLSWQQQGEKLVRFGVCLVLVSWGHTHTTYHQATLILVDLCVSLLYFRWGNPRDAGSGYLWDCSQHQISCLHSAWRQVLAVSGPVSAEKSCRASVPIFFPVRRAFQPPTGRGLSHTAEERSVQDKANGASAL